MRKTLTLETHDLTLMKNGTPLILKIGDESIELRIELSPYLKYRKTKAALPLRRPIEEKKTLIKNLKKRIIHLLKRTNKPLFLGEIARKLKYNNADIVGNIISNMLVKDELNYNIQVNSLANNKKVRAYYLPKKKTKSMNKQ